MTVALKEIDGKLVTNELVAWPNAGALVTEFWAWSIDSVVRPAWNNEKVQGLLPLSPYRSRRTLIKMAREHGWVIRKEYRDKKPGRLEFEEAKRILIEQSYAEGAKKKEDIQSYIAGLTNHPPWHDEKKEKEVINEPR